MITHKINDILEKSQKILRNLNDKSVCKFFASKILFHIKKIKCINFDTFLVLIITVLNCASAILHMKIN